MHLEAHGLLHLDKIHMDILRGCRNHHGGLNTVIHAGYFTDYPNLVFHFPPLKFETYQMAQTQEGWTIKIKQKSKWSRPIVSLYNNSGFGLRLRLDGRYYQYVSDIFKEIGRTYNIEGSEHSNINRVPKPARAEVRIEYVDRYIPVGSTGGHVPRVSLSQAMAEEMTATKDRIGDWRPGKPSMENIIPYEEFLEKMVEMPKKEPISLEELERKIAAM